MLLSRWMTLAVFSTCKANKLTLQGIIKLNSTSRQCIRAQNVWYICYACIHLQLEISKDLQKALRILSPTDSHMLTHTWLAHSPHACGVKQVLGVGDSYGKPWNRECKAIQLIKNPLRKIWAWQHGRFLSPSTKRRESLFPNLGRVGDEVTHSKELFRVTYIQLLLL